MGGRRTPDVQAGPIACVGALGAGALPCLGHVRTHSGGGGEGVMG